MPVPTIFLIDSQGEIVEMNDQPYDSECLLQELLAKCPSVLAGDRTLSNGPVRWLFVTREAGIPDSDGAADRWSLDHVFLDQNGVPTLVEVKRSTDTRIRREVVGQMLDYAANAVLYWPVDTIRQRFEETCRERGVEPDFEIANFLATTGAAEHESVIARFWESVETNLRAGKVRLIFAADEIPPELRRVVEFLNEQMNPAEVLAIEIRQYVGTGVRTLVPTVIRSSKRLISSVERPSVQWNRDSFIAALRERRGEELVSIAHQIWEWSPRHCPTVWWGEGRKDGSCFLGISQGGVNCYPFAMWTYGRIQLQFQLLQNRGVATELIKLLAAALNEIPGVSVPEDVFKYPSFEMSLLKQPEMLSRFLLAVEKIVDRIKTDSKSAPAVDTERQASTSMVESVTQA